MKCYQFAGEFDTGYGMVYFEVDFGNDTVKRQVANYGDVWHRGFFDGEKLCGYISDRYASELSLKPEEGISKERFEQMWQRAVGPEGKE